MIDPVVTSSLCKAVSESMPQAIAELTGGSPHSPNESLHLETFEHAILSEALLLARLGDH